jgi:N utilization substance protein A
MANELIQIVRQIGNDRGVNPEVLFTAIESAVLAAAKKNMPQVLELRAEIDRRTGEVHLFAQKAVVTSVTDDFTEITTKAARKIYGPEVKRGMIVEVEIHAEDLGRIAAQSVKQVVMQKIREAQRVNVFEEYHTKEWTVVSGIVQRFDHDGIVIDLEHAEALIPYKEAPKNHGFRQGERLRCLCIEVRQHAKGPQVVLSRTHPELVSKLFEQEVPEIADGVVTIESVSREPGERAKIAVSCKEKNVDPVGACVGMKGSRVQVVVRELKGEKVDIVPYSEDYAQFIANALNPAKILKVHLDPDEGKAIVVVEENQLSLAIGKHGQNARLASKLTGWNLDIITEQEDDTRDENGKEIPKDETAPEATEAESIETPAAESIETPVDTVTDTNIEQENIVSESDNVIQEDKE